MDEKIDFILPIKLWDGSFSVREYANMTRIGCINREKISDRADRELTSYVHYSGFIHIHVIDRIADIINIDDVRLEYTSNHYRFIIRSDPDTIMLLKLTL